MAGGQERILRRRIKSIESTKKITKAMELIAASQIVRAQGRIAAARPYQRGMARIVLETALGDPDAAGRLLGTPESVAKVAVLAMVADRGLCGGYNTSVLRATERLLADEAEAGIEYRLFSVGKKAQSYFRYRRHPVEQSFVGMSERPTFTHAREVAAAVLTPFIDGEVDQVLIVSTRFLSAGSQKVEVRQLLPLVDPRQPAEAHDAGGGGPADGSSPGSDGNGPHGYTEFEPDEASASELTARQRAMAAATENAGELVKKYSRIMNRARQDTITTEIMEIVGGAEALRAGSDEDEGGLIIEARV
jgi:F-type H+-transporting ATPase subunit gamma